MANSGKLGKRPGHSLSFKYFHGKIGQRNSGFLALYLGGKTTFLLLQRAKEKQQPWLPIGRVAVERALRLTQSTAVKFLAVSITLSRDL